MFADRWTRIAYSWKLKNMQMREREFMKAFERITIPISLSSIYRRFFSRNERYEIKIYVLKENVSIFQVITFLLKNFISTQRW